MEKKDIKILETVLDLLADMYFKDLKGSDLVDKVIIFQNFNTLIKNLKNPPKMEAVVADKALKEKPKKKKKAKKVKENADKQS